jgi:hypothetical protein
MASDDYQPQSVPTTPPSLLISTDRPTTLVLNADGTFTGTDSGLSGSTGTYSSGIMTMLNPASDGSGKLADVTFAYAPPGQTSTPYGGLAYLVPASGTAAPRILILASATGTAGSGLAVFAGSFAIGGQAITAAAAPPRAQ